MAGTSLVCQVVILLVLTTTELTTSNNEADRKLVAEIRDILNELKGIEERSQNGANANQVDKCSDIESKAADWLDTNDVELGSRLHELTLLSWAYLTNLTDTNAEIMSDKDVELTEWLGQRVADARDLLHDLKVHHCDVTASGSVRMLKTWVFGQSVPVARDKKTINSISKLSVELEGLYGNAEVQKDGKTYRIEPEFTEIMATSRNYTELTWAWKAWRDATGPSMREKFAELVQDMNKAAKDNDMSDVGVSWRVSNYGDDDIIPMVDQLYQDILPLYRQLHAYVRHKLVVYYSQQNLDPSGPIPAHILGNMWAQEWSGVMDIVAPYPDVTINDVTPAMIKQGYTPDRMFHLAEGFFVSLGLEPMTEKFWSRSMMVQPTDGRPVQCHASAEDFMAQDDFRIKMCTVVSQSDLQTIHHEMGHIEYFMQYRHQPYIYRQGANAAFHEAIGDTIALSVMTTEHLKTINLLTTDDDDDDDDDDDGGDYSKKEQEELNQLMKIALDKIGFLPFGYLIDKYRWDVFNGNISESEYNAKWWEYREVYQGVVAPVDRSEADFDPGAKYHVPAFVPYIRYFLSFIGQFQFQRSLCEAKNHSGRLSHCDIYNSEEAGQLLKSVLELGSSQPWRDVMELFTGSRDFSTDAIYSYFDPLYTWLKQYNIDNNIPVGW